MSEPNVELVRAWVEAFNRGDTEASIELCDPDFELVESQTLPGAARVSGHEGLRRYERGWRRNWSDQEWRVEELIDLPPNRVLLIARLWLKGLRSGAEVERRWTYLFTVRDGKLLRQDGYDSKEEALGALGGEAP
jgi:ketosteroid isomerase-like protein